jgi:hypothetical protein
MTEDATTLLDILRGKDTKRQGTTARWLAMEASWYRDGKQRPVHKGGPEQSTRDQLNVHRAVVALHQLLAEGQVKMAISGHGTRWKAVATSQEARQQKR